MTPSQGLCPPSLPRGPMKTYHFSSPDVKGPSLRLLEHLGGDLGPQAAGAVQGPDVQVGVNALKGGQGSGAWGSLGSPLGPGCALPVWGLGWHQGGRAQVDSPGTLPHWPVLFLHPDWGPPLPTRPPPALPGGTGLGRAPRLTLKASCSSSTMLDESSCSTPSEDTGKYRCSFCGEKARPRLSDSCCIQATAQGYPRFAEGSLRPEPCCRFQSRTS